MLINVVILFIKDLLPIFILLCLVISSVPPNTISTNKVLITISLSIFGVVTTFNILSGVSDLFGGIGIEILESIELSLIFFCLLFSSAYMITRRQLTLLQVNLMIAGIILFFINNSIHFIIFIESYIANGDATKNITIGLIIGSGICLSFSALLYFIINFLTTKAYFSLIYFIWALFLTGHISQTINLLQQVDFITGSEAIWDSSDMVKDNSEYGHLLKTLFGYEASPSFEFVVFYIFSLILFLIYFLKQTSNKRQYIVDSAKENNNVL